MKLLIFPLKTVFQILYLRLLLCDKCFQDTLSGWNSERLPPTPESSQHASNQLLHNTSFNILLLPWTLLWPELWAARPVAAEVNNPLHNLLVTVADKLLALALVLGARDLSI